MVKSAQFLRNPVTGRAVAGLQVAFVALLLVAGLCDPAHAEQSGPFAGLVVDPSLERYSPKSQVSGGFRVQGSDTMHALMRRLVTDFQARQPKISIDLKSGGSAKAIAEFIEGRWTR